MTEKEKSLRIGKNMPKCQTDQESCVLLFSWINSAWILEVVGEFEELFHNWHQIKEFSGNIPLELNNLRLEYLKYRMEQHLYWKIYVTSKSLSQVSWFLVSQGTVAYCTKKHCFLLSNTLTFFLSSMGCVFFSLSFYCCFFFNSCTPCPVPLK